MTSDQEFDVIGVVKDRIAEILTDLKDDRDELNEILDRAGVPVLYGTQKYVKEAIEKAIQAVDGDPF